MRRNEERLAKKKVEWRLKMDEEQYQRRGGRIDLVDPEGEGLIS